MSKVFISGSGQKHYQCLFLAGAALQLVSLRRLTGKDASGHYFHRFFLFLPCFSVTPFSHRRSARIKKLIQGKLTGAATLLQRSDLGFLIWLGSKNLFSKSCSERPITQGQKPSQTPSAILGPPGGHFGFCRRFHVSHRRNPQIKKPI